MQEGEVQHENLKNSWNGTKTPAGQEQIKTV